MRILFPFPKTSVHQVKSISRVSVKFLLKLSFVFIVSLSITFSNFAQEEEPDILDKVLDDKPKKSEAKKTSSQQAPAGKDKKKKSAKNTKKGSKTASKQLDPNKKNKPPINPDTANTGNSNSHQIINHKLNLEYWIHEELTMSPQNIPGFEDPKAKNLTVPPKVNTISEKPIEKKNPEKILEKDSKPNPLIAFLNEYKKIIFIFAAIIIFAIYRLRYAGARNYNNSGRIFSKFRNK